MSSANDDSLVERVHSSYQKLAEVASDLNTVSDSLGQMIAELDLALKRLNLGITVWVQIRGDFDDEFDYWSEDLGYAKIGSKWGIALRARSGNPNEPESESVEEWLFSDAPRQLRLSAIENIPELFEKLSEQAVKTTEKIVKKLLATRDLVSAVKKAAAEPTNASQLPIRARPTSGGQQ